VTVPITAVTLIRQERQLPPALALPPSASSRRLRRRTRSARGLYLRPARGRRARLGMLDAVRTADASFQDWSEIWPILRQVAQAGETFCWPRDISEDQARAYWMQPPPKLTLVLRDAGAVVGTATLHPNHAGPAMHVANASFAVDPRCRGRGVGRQLAEDTLARARAEGYRAMQFNAVVETNEGAVALWKSLGFRVLTTVPEAFLHPTAGYVGLHIMHRSL